MTTTHPPLGLIAEIEHHRQVNAEGRRPDSSTLLTGLPCAGAAPDRSLDKAEGFNNTHPATSISTMTVGRPTLACQDIHA